MHQKQAAEEVLLVHAVTTAGFQVMANYAVELIRVGEGGGGGGGGVKDEEEKKERGGVKWEKIQLHSPLVKVCLICYSSCDFLCVCVCVCVCVRVCVCAHVFARMCMCIQYVCVPRLHAYHHYAQMVISVHLGCRRPGAETPVKSYHSKIGLWLSW